MTTRVKNLLKSVIIDTLKVNKSIAEYQKSITKNRKNTYLCNKIIRETEKAISIIRDVNHSEILESLYKTFVGGKESFYYAILSSVNNPNTIQVWDKSEEGFKKFLELEQDAKEKYENEIKEKKEQREMIEKAKKEGKKVEMMLKDGKLKPVIVEDNNA